MSRSASSGSGPAPARPRAWASLPPIQRAAGSMPLVAAPGQFVDALPGTQGLPPIVQQLGHEVSPIATPGLVVARVRAVEQASSGSMPAPAQRRGAARTAQREAATSIPEEPAWTAEASTSSPMPASASAELPEPAAAVAQDAAPQPAPVRSLPTVARSAVRVPDRPLTSAASAMLPTAQRSHAGHSHATSPAASDAASATSLPVPSGGMRRVPSGSDGSRSVAPTVSRQASRAMAASDATGAAGPVSAPASPALPSLSPTRRGLGEPTSLPAAARPIGEAPSPVVSRSTIGGSMPLATSRLRPTIQRTADEDDGDDGAEGAPVQRSIATAGASTGTASPSLPTLPVLGGSRAAREAIASSIADGGTSQGAGSAAAAAVQRVAAGPVVRPIAAFNPLRPSVALQRDADGDADMGDDDHDAGLPSPWWAPAADGPSGPAVPGITGPQAGPAVQRSAFGAPGPVAASATHGPAVQRTARGSSAPAPRAAMPLAAPPSGAAPRGGSTASASGGVPDWHAPGTTVVFPQRTITSDPVVQTSRAGAPSPVAAPTVQREGAAAASGATSAPAAGSAAAPASRAGSSERDLDELAKQLFGRIRTRLRADLLQDREASGFTFDNV